MNHFGRVADDLTSLEMSIDAMLDMPHATQLKAALQRAFVEACKASRAQRLMNQGAQMDDVSLNGTRGKITRVAVSTPGRRGAPAFKIASNNAAFEPPQAPPAR